MAEINKEARDSFYKELAHRLTAEGYGKNRRKKRSIRARGAVRQAGSVHQRA